ncbi:DUF5007 domain-containing protein [Flavobacterium ranwuense]|uniref:DUF5007 domain-containing protein n=1 Tax=Flavobacterium ranwuense TaxID=2541725 RepID=A0ABY2DPX8_9FLAO|nr:DUF5007 domain-containing protein [Flavobacterium ranwuense]TDE28460.1 DUF5007 domain-containing protein [Flavobacterium ranwuense]
MKKIICFLMITAFISSCEQPEVGYISDNIHALQDTITVPRGVFMSSVPPAVEGSTYPIEWKITGITDKDGKPSTELQEEHEILIWKKSFDPTTDTTLELAMKKLELSKRASILMNPVSGEFIFTQATKFVVKNNFNINISAKNVRGERQLDKFTHVKLGPFNAVEFPNATRVQTQFVNQTTGALTGALDYQVVNQFDPKIPNVLNGTDKYFSVKKVSDEPKLGIKVKMIVADSKNTPIAPSKVIFFVNGGATLANFHDNTITPEISANGTTFALPAPPFPQYSRTYRDPNDLNRFLMYYLTTNDAYTFDRAAFEAEKGVKPDSFYAPFKDANGNIVVRGYIRWAIKINDSGTYELTMRNPYTIKK